MTLGRIFNLVEQGVQDPSFTREEHILPLVNDFTSEVCSLLPLPMLQVTDDILIEADSLLDYVDLPDEYGRDLFIAFNNTNGRAVNIRANVRTIERLHHDSRQGHVTDIAVAGRRLYYRPIPDVDQDLTVTFYRIPVLIDDALDEDQAIDGIPSEYNLVAVDFVLMKLFAVIEDGMDGRKINTERYTEQYGMGLARLADYCRLSPRTRPVHDRSARFF
jgi:hypothetical protein